MNGSRTRQRAVGLVFVVNGLTLPALLPRLPQVRDAVSAEPAAFGLALLGTGVGGIVGSMLAPRALARIGPRRSTVGFAVLLAGATVLVGGAGSVPALFVALGLMGLFDGVADVAMNHLLFEVQRTTTRSLISRMHALWSVGALAGAGVGTASAALGISVLAQTAGLAVVGALGVAAAVPGLRRPFTAAPLAQAAGTASDGASVGAWEPPTSSSLPEAADRTASTAPTARRGRRWGLVVVAAVAVAAVEGIANEWSALTLRDGLGAGPALAGAGPMAFAGAMLVGRLLGDRAIDRWGRAGTARAGGLAVVLGAGAGLALAHLTGAPAWLVAGLAVAGVGAATLFPSMLGAGDHIDPSGRGVAVAGSAARGGLLGVPLVMGGIADVAGFTPAFVLLPVVGVVATVVLPAALGGPLRPGRPGRGSRARERPEAVDRP